MKLSPLALVFLAFGAVGCGHKVTESDIVGSWVKDPAVQSKSKYPEIHEKLVFTFTPDHKFVLASPSPASFEGTWSYDAEMNKLGVTPTTLIVQPPGGQRNAMPIAQAMQSLQSNPQMAESLSQIAKQQFYEVTEGGKKMTENGRPALVKRE